MPDFLQILSDPARAQEDFFKRCSTARSCHFVLCLGATATSDLPGISAAGVTPADRRLTPALDAEALLEGRVLSADSLPVSPRGIVSPVVLTRAALRLAKVTASVVDCGSFVAPKCSHVRAGAQPARCISSGAALDLVQVQALYSAGRKIAGELCQKHDLLLFAECVPGGTTTAMAVLTALGYKLSGHMSSSLPVADHDGRARVVESGLKHSPWNHEQMSADPLLAIAAVGDPMQAFAAGFVCAVAQTQTCLVLSGGSQMLAVWALSTALQPGTDLAQRACVVTTKYVAFDASARTAELARMVQAPFACSSPDLYASKHKGLQAYEQGNVKEGVGAGAAMALAFLRGSSATAIVEAIDQEYDQLVLSDRPIITN